MILIAVNPLGSQGRKFKTSKGKGGISENMSYSNQ
jgi:hypothetical protein